MRRLFGLVIRKRKSVKAALAQMIEEGSLFASDAPSESTVYRWLDEEAPLPRHPKPKRLTPEEAQAVLDEAIRRNPGLFKKP